MFQVGTVFVSEATMLLKKRLLLLFNRVTFIIKYRALLEILGHYLNMSGRTQLG